MAGIAPTAAMGRHQSRQWSKSTSRDPPSNKTINCVAQSRSERYLTRYSLVAIQGLAANYDWTWTKKPEKPEDGSRGVMWLRDLLPHDVPEARVLTFEYDSKWLKDPSLVSIRDCADRLIESVLWDRTHLGETKVCRHMVSVSLVTPLCSWHILPTR